MIDLSKTVAAAIVMMATMLAPASAVEPIQKPPEAVRTLAVASPPMEIAHRSNPGADAGPSEARDANGWGMLAAGLCIGLLIISRRRRG